MQRYNEQLHQLVATENVCRELRSRLHRQQRHTLQFKAALERSLEMPHIKPPIIDPPDNVDDTATAQLESLLAAVKSSQVPVPPAFNASPVKPWSEPAEHSEAVAASDAIDPESIANQELNKLAQVSGIQLHPTETNQPQEQELTLPLRLRNLNCRWLSLNPKLLLSNQAAQNWHRLFKF